MTADGTGLNTHGASTEDSGVLHPSAMSMIVRDHHRSVYRYAYRLTGSSADADDLTQQTILQAQLQLRQLRDVNRMGAWLFRIARNAYLQDRRRNRPISVADIELCADQIVESEVESAIDAQRLQQQLSELPVDYRMVVLMFYFEELTYREIADQLAIPIGTVMSRLARAKQQLRIQLARNASTLHSSPSSAALPSAGPPPAGPSPAGPHSMAGKPSNRETSLGITHG